MRTIQSILSYKLNTEQINLLKQSGIYNWIGGEWENIEDLLVMAIELIPWFDIVKTEKLVDDMRQLAVRHDIEYYFKLGFYIANFRFAKWLFHLLHWSSFLKRLWVALIAFKILNKFWKKHYDN
jgi:hypothetical protein